MRFIQVTLWVPARENVCGYCFTDETNPELLREQLINFFKPEVERLKKNGRLVRIYDKQGKPFSLSNLPVDGRELALFRSMDKLKKGMRY